MDRRRFGMDEELAGCKRVEAAVSGCLCALVMWFIWLHEGDVH